MWMSALQAFWIFKNGASYSVECDETATERYMMWTDGLIDRRALT